MTGRTDDNDVSWGATIGYRFNRNIGVELGYVDLGELTADIADATGATNARASTSFSAAGVTLALLATFPIGDWEPYVRTGLLFSNTVLRFSGSVSGDAFAAKATNDDQDALYGIGIRYSLSERLQLYVDSTYFMEVGEPETGRSDMLNTSAGLLLRF